MTESINSNKRIAKNTLILYLRMFITVIISFYVSRIVLKYLVISDYGVYNIVGGFVSMFYIITTAMSGSVSRFLTTELGTGNVKRLNDIFCMSIVIQMIFAVLVIIIGETIGYWFVNHELQIPTNRVFAANVVYQCTIISFVVELVVVPYSALVVAHEKIGFYAFIQVLHVLLALLTALLIVFSPIDKLIFFAVITLTAAIVEKLFFVVYCRKFKECIFRLIYKKDIFNQMFFFGGWTLLTGISSMCKTQGVNIMLNIFMGTVVNAAYGVARQLEGTVRAFSKNFLLAIYPQITKSYSNGDYSRSSFLVYRGTKYAFILLYFVGLPLMLEIDTFLGLWLVEVPKYTSGFVILIIIQSLVEVLLIPMNYINQATGDIKLFQIVSSLVQFAVLPIGYVMLRIGCTPYSILYSGIILELVTLPWRVTMNKKCAGITFGDYNRNVLSRIIPLVFIPSIICLIIQSVLPDSILSSLVIVIVSLILLTITSFVFAFDKKEKEFAKVSIKNRIVAIRKRVYT